MPADRKREIRYEMPLLLQESGGDGPFNPDGTVTCVIMRPGRSIGFGKRVYPASVLERDAAVFKGRPSFENHESPTARKARGRIPRAPSELAGELRETWWDGSYSEPEDGAHDYEPGAVMGKLSPTRFIRELIEACPNSLKLSIRAYATSLRNGTYKGAPAEICEGIDDDDETSVDVVTRAGAGGRVLALMESGYDQTHGDAEALEEASDEHLLAHLRAHRPHLLESRPEPVEEEHVPDEPTTPETKAVTIDDLLGSPELGTKLNELIEAQVSERVEAATREHRELVEAQMVPRRQVELRDLRTIAHDLITDSKLPESFQEDLRLRYSLEESADGSVKARPSLDVHPEFEGTGEERKIVKSARKVLEDALSADIGRERLKLAEARPTRVRGQGAAGTDPEAGGEGTPTTAKPRVGGWREQLRKTGVDPDRLAKVNSGRLED